MPLAARRRRLQAGFFGRNRRQVIETAPQLPICRVSIRAVSACFCTTHNLRHYDAPKRTAPCKLKAAEKAKTNPTTEYMQKSPSHAARRASFMRFMPFDCFDLALREFDFCPLCPEPFCADRRRAGVAGCCRVVRLVLIFPKSRAGKTPEKCPYPVTGAQKERV